MSSGIRSQAHLQVVPLEAVLVLASGSACALVALARAGKRSVEVWQQQQGQVGIEPAELAMQRQHARGAKLSAAPLVGLRGIGVAIAEHDGAAIECRANHFCDRLRAVGKHQAELSEGIDAGAARIKQQAADAIAQPCASGLARHDDVFAAIY